MKEKEFEHFRKLQTRYWITEKIHPKDLIDGFTKKINHIENRVFGKSEDDFSGQTQIKIILNGLSLKIYYFLKQSIIYTQNKEYISAIALLRLCLEHIVMLSHFEVNYHPISKKITLKRYKCSCYLFLQERGYFM